MQPFVLLLIVVVMTGPFLVKLGLVPRPVDFVPELMGVFALLVFLGKGMRTGFRNVRAAYWMVLGAIAIHMLLGVIANGVDPGSVFAGLRTYFRSIPLLLLPSVCAFREDQVRTQLHLILAFAFVQLPIALYQSTRPGVTGDAIYGTLLISSFLSIFLIAVACVLTAFYLRGGLGRGKFLMLLALVLAPATFNETKGTLVLLPIALLAVFLTNTRPGGRVKSVLMATGLSILFIAVFAPIYNYTQRDYERQWVEEDRTIEGYFLEGKIEDYMYGGARGVGVSSKTKVKRLDALIVPLSYLAKDPIRFVFGVGIGNASESALGKSFTGEYFRMFDLFLLHTAAKVLLETGVLGLTLVLWLFWIIFSDARHVSNSGSGTISTIALGWTGVVVLLVISMAYKQVMESAALSYLFWYVSGLVAAHRIQGAPSTLRDVS